MERQRYRRTGLDTVIVDADSGPDLLGRMLYLPKTIRAAAVEIYPRIPDPDHDTVIHPHRFYMDAFVLSAVHGLVKKVPQYEGEQVLVGANFDVSIYLIDD
jgi:hypothetical protein